MLQHHPEFEFLIGESRYPGKRHMDLSTRQAEIEVEAQIAELTQKYREAMWDYLWVDTVYFADREQQAKALYHLAEVFDKLGDAVKSREAKERLLADARLKDTRYQKMTVR